MTEDPLLKFRRTKPYVLLLDPVTDRAAGYNAQHVLTVPMASAALVAFGKQKATAMADWVDDWDYGPRERPDWVPKGSLAGWRLVWLRDTASTLHHLQEMPDK